MVVAFVVVHRIQIMGVM